jgi:hypothetical protein
MMRVTASLQKMGRKMSALRRAATARSPWALLGISALGAATVVTLSPAPATAEKAPPAVDPATTLARPSLPSVPASGELGFVFDVFTPAIQPGMAENCPEGYAGTNSENYLASLAPAERARLSRPENEPEFARLWKAATNGPNNTNVCTNYNLFPERAVQRIVQGKSSIGLDLDGDDSGATNGKGCAHGSFVSPDGRRGIDNQSYRAMGCTRIWRGVDGTPGDMTVGNLTRLRNGEDTIVLVLRNVQSLVRDDDVEVIIASSLDAPIVDAQGKLVTGATFQVSDNARWRTVLHGRIVNGLLTTDAKTITLRHPILGGMGPRAERDEWTFGDGRLRLEIQPDGTLKGVLGGYMPLYTFIDRPVAAGVGTAQIVNMDCAAAYNTLKKLADGGRDPRTGQCTTISSAFELSAVPAFVKDRKS